VDSSLAYQGKARGLGYAFIENINSYALKNFMPDYTIFLNLPPEQAFLRKGGVDKTDRLELSGMDFHNKVYEGYLELAKKYQDRFVVIDASGSREQTQEKIKNALKERGII
jgi:dTMP kinase